MKTDIQLRDDVLAELEWEPSIHAAQIGVESKSGVVTLVGRVESYGEKWAAERAVQRVAGVQAVAVELEVHLPSDCTRNDTDIAAAVNHALAWQVFIPSKDIKTMVEGGFVTLSGTVTWEYQRHAAANAVRYLTGVTGISNQITVTPTVSLRAVKEEIESALKRRARTDSQKIHVAVSGSDVTLSGIVPDWNERSVARHTAWSTPGVKSVIDHMKSF